ncbi:alpha/beta hydrolase [Microbacterium gorillae]|uniref:alpha/beta hydrolase n=1 Tax=Microbacterium gorillae TaxID=1231063 RepID=UPI000A6576B1|nr:alpha/beta hydrolase [Microbacterium gorillae]
MSDATHPRTDAFVRAAERRLQPFQTKQPTDPVARREQAAAFDVAANRELGISGPDTASEDHTIPVPGHGTVRLRVYWPDRERAAPGAGLPIVLQLYGGGFTLAGIDWVGWNAIFRRRAQDANVIVVAADYSHAPETRFPTQPEQCHAAFAWMIAHARELGGDPNRVGIGGASSGGNLSAAVVLMNADRDRHPIRLLALEAPALDLTMHHADVGAADIKVPGAILRRIGRQLVRGYLGRSKRTARHRYASPLLVKDLSVFPPTVVYTSELDTLRGDGEAFVRRLTEAGVPATGVRYIGQTHTSGGLWYAVPAADHLHRDMVTTLRTLHDDPATYPNVSGER